MASRLYIVVSVFLLCTTALHAADESAVTVAFEPYPPYEWMEDGQIKGAHAEITAEIFRRMGKEVVFVERPWKRVMADLQDGEVFSAISAHKNAERELFAHFSSEPLSSEIITLFALKDRHFKPVSPDRLRSLRIGVVSGYTYCESFDSMKGLEKVEMHFSDQLVPLLYNKRVDAVVSDKAVFEHFARKAGLANAFEAVHVFSEVPMFIMFSKHDMARARQCASEFDRILREMREDGTVKAIEARY